MKQFLIEAGSADLQIYFQKVKNLLLKQEDRKVITIQKPELLSTWDYTLFCWRSMAHTFFNIVL